MSLSRPNSETLYLIPIANQQPYILENVSKWLIKKNNFKNIQEAYSYLLYLEKNNALQYKNTISRYHEENDFKIGYSLQYGPDKDLYSHVNEYQTSTNNLYGDDPHLYLI